MAKRTREKHKRECAMIKELMTTEMINKQKSKSKHSSNMMCFFGQYKTRQKGNEKQKKKNTSVNHGKILAHANQHHQQHQRQHWWRMYKHSK